MKNFFIITITFLSCTVSAQVGIPLPERKSNFDVLNIDINLELDVKGKFLSGIVTSEITPTVNDLEIIELDAAALNINSVEDQSGNILKFEYTDNKLKIYTGEKYSPGEKLKVSVNYTCSPQRGMYFIYPSELNPSMPYQVWTQGEDENNRYWLPIYDYPNDKATVSLKVTVDDNFKTLSIGELISSEKSVETGKRTDHWVINKPVSSYLIMIAAGEFNILEKMYGNIPIQSYTDQNINLDDAEYTFRNVPEMTRYFSEVFQYEYPWNKYAQVVVEDFMHGGMENVTATVLNKNLIYNSSVENEFGTEGTISHELGHQWWGDLITCRSWSEIWLNESFATYSDVLWDEKVYGKNEYDYNLVLYGDAALRFDSISGRYPVWAGYGRYTTNVYSKGAVILNTFKYILGDKFFPSLGSFLKDNEFKEVETTDLINSINKTTGKDYKWMFDQWIWKAGQPEFFVSYDFDENKNEIDLKVKQMQKEDSLTPVFKMPIEVRVKERNNDEVHKIEITEREQTFRLPCTSAPEFVVFDYGNNILDKLFFDKPFDDWKNQLLQSENAVDRIMALRGLERFLKPDLSETAGKPVITIDQSETLKLFENILNNDKYWGVRIEAAKILGNNSVINFNIDVLKNSYDIQTNSKVKRQIIKSTGSSRNNMNSDFIIEKIKNEKNDYIVADGISSLAICMDKKDIPEFVIPFAERNSHRDVIQRSVIRALDSANIDGTDQQIKSVIMNIAFGKDTEGRLRSAALNSLAKYARDSDVKDSALKYLDYNFIYVKNSMLNLLALSGDRSLIPVLNEELINCTNPSIRKYYENALAKLNK